MGTPRDSMALRIRSPTRDNLSVIVDVQLLARLSNQSPPWQSVDVGVVDSLRSSVGRGDDDRLRTGGSVVHVWKRCVDRTVDSEDDTRWTQRCAFVDGRGGLSHGVVWQTRRYLACTCSTCGGKNCACGVGGELPHGARSFVRTKRMHAGRCSVSTEWCWY